MLLIDYVSSSPKRAAEIPSGPGVNLLFWWPSASAAFNAACVQNVCCTSNFCKGYFDIGRRVGEESIQYYCVFYFLSIACYNTQFHFV